MLAVDFEITNALSDDSVDRKPVEFDLLASGCAYALDDRSKNCFSSKISSDARDFKSLAGKVMLRLWSGERAVVHLVFDNYPAGVSWLQELRVTFVAPSFDVSFKVIQIHNV